MVHRRPISLTMSPSIARRHLGRGVSGTTIAWKFFAMPHLAIILGMLRDRESPTRTSKPRTRS
jgi:hypothetical protein